MPQIGGAGYEIDLAELPRLGTVMCFDGRPFKLEGAEPYTRRDGTDGHVLWWRTRCSTCGEETVVTTGLRSKTVSKRCPAHKAQGVPATPEAAERRRLHKRGGS